MKEYVAVDVVCRHSGQGRLTEKPEETLLKVAVRPGEEPTGFLLSGRILSGGKVLPGSDMRSKWRALWESAWSSGELPYGHHLLTCSICGKTLRIRDLVLRRHLSKVAAAGVSSVPIHMLPVK